MASIHGWAVSLAKKRHRKEALERRSECAKLILFWSANLLNAEASIVISRSSADERELTVQPWRGPATVELFQLENVKIASPGNPWIGSAGDYYPGIFDILVYYSEFATYKLRLVTTHIKNILARI